MTIALLRDVSLKAFNTFGVESRASHFVRVESVDDLRELRDQKIYTQAPRLILGGGSNLLLTRDFDGLVVQIALKGRELAGDDGDAWIVGAAAGEGWDDFVRWTLAAGRPGLENLALIPGTVGAAPIQNIGAYGVELRDRFHELEALDMDTGELGKMSAADCEFDYRDSVFKRELRGRMVITRVSFRLPKTWCPMLDYGDLRGELAKRGRTQPTAIDVADAVTAIRHSKLPDPAVLGNAGSFFKNPIVSAELHERLKADYPAAISYPQRDGRFKLAAGWLVEQCGWKGQSLPASNQRAAIHDRQALVLVNRGEASGADILALARAVQESVERRFGVMLEPEPVIV